MTAHEKVLMLAFLFPPTAAAGSARSLRFAKYLPDFGWDPLVVTARPEFTGYGEDHSLAGQIPANTVVERTNVWFPEEAILGGLRRIITGNRSARKSLRSASQPGAGPVRPSSSPARLRGPLIQWSRQLRDRLFFTPDWYIAWSRPAIRAAADLLQKNPVRVLYSTSPPHSTHVIARRLKRMSGLPWVADFRDPWARNPWRAQNWCPSQQRSAERLEASCVRAADRVILNTDSMRDSFLETYPDQAEEKFVVIPNGFDPALLAMLSGLPQASPRMPGSKFRICHPGSLYCRRDPRPFLQAIKCLSNGEGNLLFEQFGTVAPEFMLDEFVAQNGLTDHVSVEAMVDHHTILRHMAEVDAFLLIQPDTTTQIPAKLYEMIPFGKPIIALTGDGATADIVKRYALGVVSDPDNVDDIAEAIRRITHDNAVADGTRKQALEDFDGRNHARRLADSLRSISIDSL